MKIFPLYHKATGLNTREDPERVGYDIETGVLGLTEAENVDIDLSGAIRRRAGYTKLTTGLCHSLFSCGTYGYCVKEGALCYIDKDLNITALKDIGNFKVAYVYNFDGYTDRVFFTNGVITGQLFGQQVFSWQPSPYIGINSTESQVVKYMPAVPIGHLLEIFNGRMYIAKDNMLYISEPFAYSWFDEKLAFIFDSRITILRGVLGGLFVATNKEVFFLAGSNPQEFSLVKAYAYGGIEGTDQLAQCSLLGIDIPGNGIIFASSQGLCIGTSTGQVLNFTQAFINFPQNCSKIGASLINNNNRYIVTLM